MTPRLEPALDLALVADPPSNPNAMPEREFRMLVEAIRSEGFLQPILVRDLDGVYEIVDGVHRVKAAREVGLEYVPAVVLPIGYPEQKVRLLQVGMNRMRGQLDLTTVATGLEDLLDSSWDVSLSGFDEAEIQGLLAAMKPPPLDLDDMGGESTTGGGESERTAFPLEIVLDSAAELKAVKKALRKVGGKGNRDLAVGLRAALGLDG